MPTARVRAGIDNDGRLEARRGDHPQRIAHRIESVRGPHAHDAQPEGAERVVHQLVARLMPDTVENVGKLFRQRICRSGFEHALVHGGGVIAGMREQRGQLAGNCVHARLRGSSA